MATLSAAVVNRLRRVANSAAVATNATTTRAQAQQQRLVMEQPKPRKLLHSIVINNQPSLLNRPPTTRPNHIPLNQLGAGETSSGMCAPFAEPSQHRHTTSLMQDLSAEDLSTYEEPDSGEEDMADHGEESEVEEWERAGGQARSGEDMAEDIRRTPPYKRTEVLSPAALADQRKKSPSTCKSHIEQATVQQPPAPPPTAQAMTLKPTFLCWRCGNYGHVGTDCAATMHSTNSLRHCTNCQETGHYSILCTKPCKPQPPNNLNAIHCNFGFGYHYGSQCNKKKHSTSVQYSNRTKKAIRTSHNLSRMPEGSNQPDHNGAQWLHDTTILNDYQRERGNEGSWEQLYLRLLDAHAVHHAKLIDGFHYIHKGSTGQLIILRGLQINRMLAQNFFIQQAHNNTGHGGLDKT